MAPVLFGELGELVSAFVVVGDEAGLEDVADEVGDVRVCVTTTKVDGLVVTFVIVGDEAGLEDIAEDVEEGGTIELINLVITEMPDVLDTEGVNVDVGSAKEWSVTAEFPQAMLIHVSGPAVGSRTILGSFRRAAMVMSAQEGSPNIYVIKVI